MTKTDTLLRELERMPYPARMRRMVELGRRAAAEPGVATTLDDLERRGVYERALALQSCYGSRDARRVLRALDDPSRTVRALALVLVPLVADPDQARCIGARTA